MVEAAPLVTAADGGPRPGCEEIWSLASNYAVELAGQCRDEAEVDRLLRLTIAVKRGRVADLLIRPADSLTAEERHRLGSLGGSLQRLGSALRDRNDPDALAPLREGYDLHRRLGNRAAEAIAAFNIGQAYLIINAVRDLAAAERWTRDSLALRDDHNSAGRANCHHQLGAVALTRFDALPATADPRERTRLLADAAQAYQTSLDLTPAYDLAGRAVTHYQLAELYARAGQPDAAIAHHKQSIDIKERLGNRHGAGHSRVNLARLLARTGRFSDALAYARAARADFAFYDGRAAAEVARTDGLIAAIEKALAAS